MHVHVPVDEREELASALAFLDQRAPGRQVELVRDRADLVQLALGAVGEERDAPQQLDLLVFAEPHRGIVCRRVPSDNGRVLRQPLPCI